MTRLWDVDHPYYGPDGEIRERFDSWAMFVDDDGFYDSDEDLNLLYRWDWLEGSDHEVPVGKAELRLFFVLQRKGALASVSVTLTRDDEEVARAWLVQRWEHCKALWAPLGGAA